jgi:hypothetical protein
VEKRVLILILVVFCLGGVLAENHYVTQSGAGAKDGSSVSNAFSVSQFNTASNWDSVVNSDNGKIGPGDSVFFSGVITSSIKPQGSGKAGNYIVFDGYEAGDCDAISESCPGQAIVTLSQDIGKSGFALWDSAYGLGNGKDYLIIQDFEIKEVNDGVYAVEGCDHIIIRRNYIHDALSHGVSLTTGGKSPRTGTNFITIGGALGDGNVLKNIGVGTGHADITLNAAHDIIVNYNHLYATPNKATGASTDKGVDGIVAVGETYNVLIEHNSIHSHNDNYGPDPTGYCGHGCTGRGEDGIDIKDDDGGINGGCHDIIVRYNHIYDHKFQSNIHPQTETHNLYIYGNRLHDSLWGGVYMKEGKCGGDGSPLPEGCELPLSHIYIFSNFIYDEQIAGSRIHMDSGGTNELHNHIYWFNNVFSENPQRVPEHAKEMYAHITMHQTVTNSKIKNNIFIKSRPVFSSLQERQIYSAGLVDEIDYNHYYWPGKTSSLYINGKSANAIGGFSGIETYGSEGDPKLVDWQNKNYRIASSDSPVVDSGAVMGIGNIAVLNIHGMDYPVRWDAALHPSTDWSTIPPTVISANQNDFGSGWERGAYVYGASAALYCGDSSCNNGESCLNCSADCGECSSVCGDLVCDSDENCSVCSADCGGCGGVNVFEVSSVEAEAGVVVEPMRVGSDSLASGGSYVYSPTNYAGSVSYRFNINESGNYFIEARIIAPSTSDDSFYVTLDSQVVSDLYAWDTIESESWIWVNVSHRGSGDHINAEFNPKIWSLDVGEHVFVIGGRESDTKLDRIVLKRYCDDGSCVCVSFEDVALVISSWKGGGKSVNEILEVVGRWKRGC